MPHGVCVAVCPDFRGEMLGGAWSQKDLTTLLRGQLGWNKNLSSDVGNTKNTSQIQ